MTGEEKLLTPAEVGALFRVAPKTVTRWAGEGWLESVLTAGGHHRFPEGQFAAVINAGPLLDRAEVAAVFRVSVHAIARWEESGSLTPVTMPGRRKRYPKRQLTGLLSAEAVA
jgi:predicted site-specific integrase-resolvase